MCRQVVNTWKNNVCFFQYKIVDGNSNGTIIAKWYYYIFIRDTVLSFTPNESKEYILYKNMKLEKKFISFLYPSIFILPLSLDGDEVKATVMYIVSKALTSSDDHGTRPSIDKKRKNNISNI